VIALAGLALATGGAWLAVLGGSWYYVLAGIGMLVAGVQVARHRPSGAWWYWAVLIGTVLWAAWESGLDYWRWVPRLDIVVLFGLLLALAWPKLDPSRSRTLSRGLAGLFALVFVAAFGLAFAPHDWTRGPAVPAPSGDPVERSDVIGMQSTEAGIQPAVLAAPGDWTAYGRTYAAQRFTPLKQITTDNVTHLQKAWTYRTGDLPDKRWGAETTPLKVGDTLYLCSARNEMMALDAGSGREIWRYDPKVADKDIPYTAACRGVSYYVVPQAVGEPPAKPKLVATADDRLTAAVADPAPPVADEVACATRVIEGTLDGRIIAVDAKTGKPCAEFGDNGQVDIKKGMGETPPGYVAITSPPVIVQGVVVTGHQVLDGQARYEPSGVIQGYDAVTGKLVWAWDMMKPDLNGLPPDGESYTRGTPNMWTTASGDEKLGLVYLPMGNSTADYWTALRRPNENEFSSALVAIDVHTGKPAWHFQTVHKDAWDYDLGSQPTLMDYPQKDGSTVPAILLPSKQGELYVLDRRSGKPLVGVEEKPAPQGGVASDHRAPTQPHSEFATLRKPDLTSKDMWGLTPFDQLACRIQYQQASYKGFYTPPTADQPFIEYPGYNGGSDWGSVAVDPTRNVIIANYNDMPNYNRLVPRKVADAKGWVQRDEQKSDAGGAEGAGDPQDGTPYAIRVNAGWRLAATGLLCKEPPYGGIRAIDLKTGETLWDRPLGTGRANGPFGIESHLPVNIGTPNNGGPVVTASGLVFIAAATDNLIRAIDLDTGKTVWSDVLPAGGQATPMIYEDGGREYLVIMAGGHHFMETPEGDYLVAYALPS